MQVRQTEFLMIVVFVDNGGQHLTWLDIPGNINGRSVCQLLSSIISVWSMITRVFSCKRGQKILFFWLTPPSTKAMSQEQVQCYHPVSGEWRSVASSGEPASANNAIL